MKCGVFVDDKDTERWLWHAIDHRTGKVLAYIVGTHKDAAFPKLQALLVPFGTYVITRAKAVLIGVISRQSSIPWGNVYAEDRTQAPYVADTPQTLGPKDAVFFPLVPHARPGHWVIYEPR